MYSSAEELYNTIENCEICPHLIHGINWHTGRDGRVLFVGIQPSYKGHPENPNRTLTTEVYDRFTKLRDEYGLANFRFTNFVKCATDRASEYPTREEFENCFHYLIEEIKLFKTQYVVFVGKVYWNIRNRSRIRVESNWCFHYSRLNSNKPWYLPKQRERFEEIRKQITELGII